MQGDGKSDDRPGASRRDPPVIDGEAREIDISGAPVSGTTPSEQLKADIETPGEVHDEALVADQVLDERGEPSAAEIDRENGSPAEPDLAAPPRKRGSGKIAAAVGILALAGAGAFVATSDLPGTADLRGRIVALLPDQAQRTLGVAADQGVGGEKKAPAAPTSESKTQPADATLRDAKSADAKSADAKPADAKPADAKLADSKPSDARPSTAKTADTPPATDRSAAPVAAPTSPVKSPPETAVNPPSAPSKPATSETIGATQAPPPSAPVATPAPAPSAAPLAIAQLVARVDALQARVEAIPAPQTGVSADVAARLDGVTQRIAALEAKLDAPKSQQRAAESRENAPAAGSGAGAARVVVAQALGPALVAGAPLGDSLAALKALGVGDDRLADLAPYAQTSPPTVAQLSAQWTALRPKVVAADAPAPGGDWADKLVAKAKGLVKIETVGVQTGSSASAVATRIDAALQRGDLAAAVQASDALPDSAKSVAADWRAAATRRLKADAAARALLTDSIAAIGRPKS